MNRHGRSHREEREKKNQKKNQQISINKATLDVGLLLSGGPEPV
jgi:hypothetical protein